MSLNSLINYNTKMKATTLNFSLFFPLKTMIWRRNDLFILKHKRVNYRVYCFYKIARGGYLGKWSGVPHCGVCVYWRFLDCAWLISWSDARTQTKMRVCVKQTVSGLKNNTWPLILKPKTNNRHSDPKDKLSVTVNQQCL